MFKYILKRIIVSILILIGVSFVLYALLRLMPTDFIEQKIINLATQGTTVTEEFKQELYRSYGLDGGIVQGYFSWLIKLLPKSRRQILPSQLKYP